MIRAGPVRAGPPRSRREGRPRPHTRGRATASRRAGSLLPDRAVLVLARPRTSEPQEGHRGKASDEQGCGMLGDPEPRQTMRNRIDGLLLEVASEGPERLEPAPPVAPRRDGDHRGRGEREAEVPDRSTRGTRLERTQHEEDGRDPLDRDRRHPGHAGELAPAGRGQGQRTEHEGHHERVVVPTAREVNSQERVPADERGGEGAAAGEAGREHASARPSRRPRSHGRPRMLRRASRPQPGRPPPTRA